MDSTMLLQRLLEIMTFSKNDITTDIAIDALDKLKDAIAKEKEFPNMEEVYYHLQKLVS